MTEIVPFSELLRKRTRSQHGASESAGFMSDLMSGRCTVDDYAAMVSQHYFVYRALEAAADAMAGDPVAAPFITARLTRLPAIEEDLRFLIGEGWQERVRPLPATARYVTRLETAATEWSGAFVAHHYTRYLGDLSGGQIIRTILQKHYGFDTNGIGFYLFSEVADPAAFRTTYRDELDAAPWTEAEKERVVDEVVLAYELNTALFDDLTGRRQEAIA